MLLKNFLTITKKFLYFTKLKYKQTQVLQNNIVLTSFRPVVKIILIFVNSIYVSLRHNFDLSTYTNAVTIGRTELSVATIMQICAENAKFS